VTNRRIRGRDYRENIQEIPRREGKESWKNNLSHAIKQACNCICINLNSTIIFYGDEIFLEYEKRARKWENRKYNRSALRHCYVTSNSRRLYIVYRIFFVLVAQGPPRRRITAKFRDKFANIRANSIDDATKESWKARNCAVSLKGKIDANCANYAISKGVCSGEITLCTERIRDDARA